jgi:hypothetical protein
VAASACALVALSLSSTSSAQLVFFSGKVSRSSKLCAMPEASADDGVACESDMFESCVKMFSERCM